MSRSRPWSSRGTRTGWSAFLNLVNNAITHAPDTGAHRRPARAKRRRRPGLGAGSRTRFPEDLPQIFARFFQSRQRRPGKAASDSGSSSRRRSWARMVARSRRDRQWVRERPSPSASRWGELLTLYSEANHGGPRRRCHRRFRGWYRGIDRTRSWSAAGSAGGDLRRGPHPALCRKRATGDPESRRPAAGDTRH